MHSKWVSALAALFHGVTQYWGWHKCTYIKRQCAADRSFSRTVGVCVVFCERDLGERDSLVGQCRRSRWCHRTSHSCCSATYQGRKRRLRRHRKKQPTVLSKFLKQNIFLEKINLNFVCFFVLAIIQTSKWLNQILRIYISSKSHKNHTLSEFEERIICTESILVSYWSSYKVSSFFSYKTNQFYDVRHPDFIYAIF